MIYGVRECLNINDLEEARERPGDSLRWRCSLIIIFVAFVLQYKYFSALTMILSYEWKFIQVATLGVASIKRSTGRTGRRRLNKVWAGLGSRGQWYEINVGRKYLWEHTKLFFVCWFGRAEGEAKKPFEIRSNIFFGLIWKLFSCWVCLGLMEHLLYFRKFF